MHQSQITDAQITRIAGGLVDIKINVDGELRLIAWRRRALRDEVSLDGRVIRTVTGFRRETVYGLNFDNPDEPDQPGARVLLTVDPTTDWLDPQYMIDGEERPRGVRIETAERVLAAAGSLDPDRQARDNESYDDWGWDRWSERFSRWFGMPDRSRER